MNKRSLILVSILLLAFIGSLWLLDRILPYSVDHVIAIQASSLADIVRSWKRSGGTVDDLRLFAIEKPGKRIFVCSTNIVLGGKTYSELVCLVHSNFRGRGMLVSTTNGAVYWMDRSGRTHPTAYSPRENE